MVVIGGRIGRIGRRRKVFCFFCDIKKKWWGYERFLFFFWCFYIKNLNIVNKINSIFVFKEFRI